MKSSKELVKLPKELVKETQSVLIDKLMQDYELKKEHVAEAVELYYDAQKLRIMHANKLRSEGQSELTTWFAKWLEYGEKLLYKKLEGWVNGPEAPAETKWAIEQYGIGPIIAAGLAAHIDVTRARTVSALWRFAGQDPTADKKVKGQKLQYNARLKTLCSYKLAESFVKVSAKEGARYGILYAEFKREELERNESGRYALAAKRELAAKNFKKPEIKKLLESGKLPDGHLHSRAKRRAVKIFLQHYWLKAREARGLEINEPYAMAILKHSGQIKAA
jgi:hypothetical protein